MIEISSVFFIRLNRLLRVKSKKDLLILFVEDYIKKSYYNIRISINTILI